MHDGSYVVKRRLAQHSPFERATPLLDQVDIELTERCNNACIHCYINLPAEDTGAAQRELVTDDWKNILRQAADLGALSVRFTGGEPLLRADFVELYLLARRLGLKVILLTNGRLITRELARVLARVPPLFKVEVSVYGMRADSYEAVTGSPGSFAEFRRGLGLLLEHGIRFCLNTVLLPQNRAEIDECEAWAMALPGIDRTPPFANLLDLRTRRDSPEMNRRIAALRMTPEESVAVAARHPDAHRTEMTQFAARFLAPQGDRLFACGAGNSATVDAYGACQMCMLLRHPDTVVDLRKSTLRHALTDAFGQLRERRATNPEYLRRCARCFLKGLCEQCPAKSWSEHGTLDTPVEYLCLVAHAHARYLGLLTEDELSWEILDWRPRVAALARPVKAFAAFASPTPHSQDG